MKRSLSLLIGFSFILCIQTRAQNYNAYDYWRMEHDSLYNVLKKRQNSGDTLSISNAEYILKYKSKLDEYFGKMSDDQKSYYFKNRSSWEKNPVTIYKLPYQQEPEIFLGEKSTFTRYLISSGVFGFYYGFAAVSVFDMRGDGVSAIPLLTAGASTLIPLLSIKDQRVTYSSLKLSLHGKTIGLLHGAALAMIFSGTDAADNEKLTLGLSSLTSIGLGLLGYRLGRDNRISPGNAALYSYYGTMMPFEAAGLAIACETEDSRIYGLSILAGGAGGYLIANQVSERYNFTPGDITSTKAFTALNALLGFGILADLEETDLHPAYILIPVATTLGGTFISHHWLKDAKMTSQQGRNTALAAGGGALIGFGVATLFQPESATPYYLLPYVSGFASYAIMVHIYNKLNQQQYFKAEKDNKFKVNFMPESIFLNQKLGKIINSNTGRPPVFLPAVAATYNF